MGQSKLPIYAYADETGNTGHNLFDEAQPDFFTAAVISKGNFDTAYGASIRALAERLGDTTLHAGQLGIGRLETIASDLLRLLQAARVDFFVSRVEKRYLLAAKIFDSICDSGENAAVAWHNYNLRPLRIILAFKLAITVDLETAQLFWKCILEPNEKTAYGMLPEVCTKLLANLERVPDVRSREVLGRALEWARSHPESIQIHTDKKLARQGHFPNMVAFTNLLEGLDRYAKDRRRRVARITHDKQSEFEQTMAMYHSMYSNASPEEFRWAGETHSIQRVVGSIFEVREDSASAGIQVADVVLWLYSQFRKRRNLPYGCTAIVVHAIENGWESDFSFEGVERTLLERFGDIMSTPLSPEKEQQAREMIERAEEARLASVARYEVDKLPPFMRETPTQIPVDRPTIIRRLLGPNPHGPVEDH